MKSLRVKTQRKLLIQMERTPNSTYFNPLLLIFIALIIGACSNRPVAITQDFPATLPPEWTDTSAVSETVYLTPTVPLEFASPTWTPTHTPTPTPAPGSILPSRTPPSTPPGNLLAPSDNSSWAIQIPRQGGYVVADRLIPLSALQRPVSPPRKQ